MQVFKKIQERAGEFLLEAIYRGLEDRALFGFFAEAATDGRAGSPAAVRKALATAPVVLHDKDADADAVVVEAGGRVFRVTVEDVTE